MPKKPTTTSQASTPTAQVVSTPSSLPRGKLGLVLQLLGRSSGATVEDLMQATGWQAHSVRGVIAGSIKKKLGLAVTSTKAEGGRVYRLEAGRDAG